MRKIGIRTGSTGFAPAVLPQCGLPVKRMRMDPMRDHTAHR